VRSIKNIETIKSYEETDYDKESKIGDNDGIV